MTKEVWIDVKNYDGLYQVSNLGRVKRVEQEVFQWNPQIQKVISVKYPKKYLKFEDDKGYNRVTLSKGNSPERFLLHRLIAEHFVSNPDPSTKTCIHHKNHQRKDNRSNNLEWVTHLENEDYKRQSLQECFKAISPDGEETVWYNRRECARRLGLQRSGIERCLAGTQSHHRGYRFSHLPAKEAIL